MTQILDKFPKVRTPLPIEFEEIYAKHYKENREGNSRASGLAQKMESWMHRQVAADVVQTDASQKTLEVGAGTLNHLRYEPLSTHYDIVEPFRELYESSPFLHKINSIFPDISEIPPAPKYDRIISIATFEHICNLPEVIARCCLLLTPNGKLRVAIPSEGTILWYLGYKLTTGLEFQRQYNLNYEILMKYEHVNTALEIETVIRHFFGSVKREVFGVSRFLSFYQFFECSQPELKRSASYLGSLSVEKGYFNSLDQS